MQYCLLYVQVSMLPVKFPSIHTFIFQLPLSFAIILMYFHKPLYSNKHLIGPSKNHTELYPSQYCQSQYVAVRGSLIFHKCGCQALSVVLRILPVRLTHFYSSETYMIPATEIALTFHCWLLVRSSEHQCES